MTTSILCYILLHMFAKYFFLMRKKFDFGHTQNIHNAGIWSNHAQFVFTYTISVTNMRYVFYLLTLFFFFSFFHLVCLKWQMDPGVNFIIIVVDIMYKNIFIHVTINK